MKKTDFALLKCKVMTHNVIRGEYPTESSKDQKRLIRRKVKARNDDGLETKRRGTLLRFHEVRRPRATRKKSGAIGGKAVIIRDCHEAEIGRRRFKRFKTFGKISERFYWQGMMKDVREYISTCDVCQPVDGKNGKQHAELHPYTRIRFGRVKQVSVKY